MDKPTTETIKKQVEELTGFVDLVAEIWHGKNWVKRLVLLDVLLFIAFNPYFKTALRFIPDSWLPHRYELFFWLVIAIVFIIALAIGIRSRAAKRQSRIFDERSPIKGLLPFGKTDQEIFKQLQRGTELTECYQAVADHSFRFGVLSGESGAGKTSFLQAGLWPALLDQHSCVYVKFTDLDPVAAIRQAFDASGRSAFDSARGRCAIGRQTARPAARSIRTVLRPFQTRKPSPPVHPRIE